MLLLQTELEGKRSNFGVARDCVCELGYHMGGNWDYHKGYFDHRLCREGGETIYVRIPFHVTHGELDNYEAEIQFDVPYIIKHVVNIGLDRDGGSLSATTGFNQFQPPRDLDGKIDDKSRWIHAGEEAIKAVVNCLYEQEHQKSG